MIAAKYIDEDKLFTDKDTHDGKIVTSNFLDDLRTYQSIAEAFQDKLTVDSRLMINQTIVTIQNMFPEYIIGIRMTKNHRMKDEIDERKYKNSKYFLMKSIINAGDTPGDLGFVKYAFDRFYFDVTVGGKLKYHYHYNYLMSPAKAAERLGVSRQTVNKYVKMGLEVMEDSNGKHGKIPEHAVILWGIPQWASNLQFLHADFQQRESSLQERIKSITEDILEFEHKYKGEFEDVFSGYGEDPYNLNEETILNLEDDLDYNEWKWLLMEQKRLLEARRMEIPDRVSMNSDD